MIIQLIVYFQIHSDDNVTDCLFPRNFSSVQEKLECEAEAQQLAEARKLLEEEEKSFAQHQHAEMARIETELEVWERQKAAEIDALHLARRELLWQNSDKLRQLDGQIEEQKQVLVEAKDEVKQVNNTLQVSCENSDMGFNKAIVNLDVI